MDNSSSLTCVELKLRNVENYSPLELRRLKYKAILPPLLQSDPSKLKIVKGEPSSCVRDAEQIQNKFPQLYGSPPISFVQSQEHLTPKSPLRVGCVLSGGQAPGGHSCITGLFDSIKAFHPDSKLFGFIGGPGGIVHGNFAEITQQVCDRYRHQGGFDMIGSGRTKIESDSQLNATAETVSQMNLDGLVVIGGDDSNTNAAMLAEYFKQRKSKLVVIGLPKTIDGDLQVRVSGPDISFGFHTATQTYSSLIGNVATDAISAAKYWFFLKLMGRSASWITLECALQTHPNHTLISEMIAEKKLTLAEITSELADLVSERAAIGKAYGVVLIPEGFIDFVPELHEIISEISDVLANHPECTTVAQIVPHLSKDHQESFSTFPSFFQETLCGERDDHGNVPLSQIPSDELLIYMVQQELDQRYKDDMAAGTPAQKVPFKAQHAFFGYEGRSCLPTDFDTSYCTALGSTAGVLIANGRNNAETTGYMAVIQNLSGPISSWIPAGIPITSLLCMEKRKNKLKPVIEKGLVSTSSPSFLQYMKLKDSWRLEDHYRNPGPIQFHDDSSSVCPIVTSLDAI